MNDYVRLIYTSTRAPDITKNMLQEIQVKSQENNRRFGITGLLAHNQDHFMQLLDGPAEKVNLVYKWLILDQRHKDLRLIHYGQLSGPKFCDWSMHLLEIPTWIIHELRQEHNEFSPYALNAQDALEIMEMLRDRAI